MKRGVVSNYVLKVIQQEGSPTCIARGVALGLAAGLIIPIGFQTLIVVFLAFLLRANKVLSWTFTCITNPATVLLIYPIQCYVGSFILLNPIKISDLSNKFNHVVQAENAADMWRQFLAVGNDIMLSFFVGGLFFALLIAPPGYFISYRLASYYQKRKQAKKALLEEKRKKSAS